MLEWLKTILGDAYTEDIDKKVSSEIGKEFVSRTDFNAANEAKKAAESQVTDRDKQLETLKKSTGDAAELQKQIDALQETNKQAKAQYDSDLAAAKLSAALDLGITKAVKEDGTVDGLDTALETLKGSDGYLFTQEETKPQGNGFQTGTQTPDAPETKAVADAFAAARGTI